MHDDEEDSRVTAVAGFIPWTADGAARLQAAAADLVAAVTVHARAVTAVTGEAGIGEVLAANEHLLRVAASYADAQFHYTGNDFPFGALQQYLDDATDPSEQADTDRGQQPAPGTGITVLQRRDYRVTDDAAVLAAGREAYLRAWPGEDHVAAAADVSHLGRALYQLAHADGWNSLDQTDGLHPTGAAVVVHAQDTLLGPQPHQWPEDPFHTTGKQIFRHDDVFPA